MYIRESDFEFLRQLVYDQSSIHLGEEKKELVCSRLNNRLARFGLRDVGEYCDLLKSNQEPGEVEHLIDAVSTHFTTFFREVDHFRFLKDQIVPEFLAATPTGARETFYAWSAGCSTGEEAYSLAIVLDLCFRGADPAWWQILATDISARVLETARNGIYEANRVQLPNPAWLPHFFQKGQGDWLGHFRVKQALREQIHFTQQHLLQPDLSEEDKFHVIFCRNVMIYFDRATSETLIARLIERLHPGGYLIIGRAESLGRRPRGLESVRSSIFRKPTR